MATNPALLLLADARFPSGGHAHSGGTEPAVGAGDVGDVTSLERFVRGRLRTTGRVDAAFAVAAWSIATTGRHDAWGELNAEHLARTASPRLRQTSATLGRLLLRAGRRAFPSPGYDALTEALGPSVPQPLAMGAVTAAAGLSAHDTALCQLHQMVGALSTAGVRLLGLDPFAIAAVSASLTETLHELAADAAVFADVPAAELPADVALLNDVLAEHHGTWEVRLFAS